MQKFNPKKTKRLKQINAICRIFFHEGKKKTAFDWENYENILVLDFNMIGDMVMLIPFLRILKKNAPNARITLVCGSWGKAVLEEQGLADEFVVCNSRILSFQGSAMEGFRAVKDAWKRVNQKEYDVALEPRGDLRDIFFMHYCKAKRKVSYNYTGGECFLTDVITPSEKVEHLVEDKIYFLEQLGCRYEEKDRYPRLRLTKAREEANESFLCENRLKGRLLIGIHPGASMEIKQWTGFGELLKKIHGSGGNWSKAAFLVFEGPKEREAAALVMDEAKACGAKAILSRTDIPNYMQKLAMCDIVICNDSGAGHIAAAYGDEVHVIFGPVEPKLAKPYAKEKVFVYSDGTLPCKPCFSTVCERDRACIKSITVDMVFENIVRKVGQ